MFWFYIHIFNNRFFAGKRVVKPSKMTKEMDADRVKIPLALFPCSFSLNLLLVSVVFFILFRNLCCFAVL